jgi:hypothetical protein
VSVSEGIVNDTASIAKAYEIIKLNIEILLKILTTILVV